MSKEEDLYCHYSGLPSPMAYTKSICTDYDSMGNHGRFPKTKQKQPYMKKFIKKLTLWWSYVKPKKNRKSIWKL
jgi:hypothetical protein